MDRYEPLLLGNKDAFSSTTPILVACIDRKSPRNISDTSTVLAARPVSASRGDIGTATRGDDNALTMVRKLGRILSTLACEEYSCEEENSMYSCKVCSSAPTTWELAAAFKGVRIC